VLALTEHDGSFRRLMEMVKEQQAAPDGRPGRPPKNRVPTTGHFGLRIHERMKGLAKERSKSVEYTISTSDLYNVAALQLITDLHDLLGEELRLPAGAVTMDGILGLRELIDRPMLTPLRDLGLQTAEQQRTTLYLDQPIWDALIEMSLRFGLRLRRTIHVHRLIELGAAWYLAGIEESESN
jgi:hypothetical protein